MTPFRSTVRTASAMLIGAALLGCFLGSGKSAHGQRAYNHAAAVDRGAQAYFSGRSFEAEQLLSLAIGSGSQDPRAFYFRGLSRLRQGRRYEAETDFQIGASLEASGAGGGHNIGHVLMNVQGGARQLLEKHRRIARNAPPQQTRIVQSPRRRRPVRAAESTLRKKPALALDLLASPSTAAAAFGVVPTETVARNDPFADNDEQPFSSDATEAAEASNSSAAADTITPPVQPNVEPAEDDQTVLALPEVDPFGGDDITSTEQSEVDEGQTGDIGFGGPPTDSQEDDAEAFPFADAEAADEPSLDFLDQPAVEENSSPEPVETTPSPFADDASTEEKEISGAAEASAETDIAIGEESKVAPSSLGSIIGRVFGRATGLSNVAEMARSAAPSLESFGPQPMVEPPMEEFELGPEDTADPDEAELLFGEQPDAQATADDDATELPFPGASDESATETPAAAEEAPTQEPGDATPVEEEALPFGEDFGSDFVDPFAE